MLKKLLNARVELILYKEPHDVEITVVVFLTSWKELYVFRKRDRF
jgi:hypothetical protein